METFWLVVIVGVEGNSVAVDLAKGQRMLVEENGATD